MEQAQALLDDPSEVTLILWIEVLRARAQLGRHETWSVQNRDLTLDRKLAF